MRILILLSVVTLCGCQLCGFGQDCESAPACAADQACGDQSACKADDCQKCSTWGSAQNWVSRHTPTTLARHAKFKRFEDNIMTRHEARSVAQSELKHSDNKACQTCDYRLGYEQAFVDVAQGACGAVPALPPANYWKVCARTPEGHQRAQEWFNGYAAGAAAAKSIYEPYNRVAASQFYEQAGCGQDGNCQTDCQTNSATNWGAYYGQ
ncbi:hypothetical protein [Planctomicrobium piriforme]|uniref:Lipoprotein n=1 Tax=Planctomicrobium piriforme TaxID=1576369 RepID=A0A1I3AVR5_9PLAN|nr:hypothetical protein [Planctomicrobium piriforme]SFH54040.1 hypothetical protein SAMN05421753_10179 [Planctomicrobium piriforme]